MEKERKKERWNDKCKTLSHTHTHAMQGKIRRQKLTHTFSHTHKLALDGERERNTLEKN
jgi:hypothetical protein